MLIVDITETLNRTICCETVRTQRGSLFACADNFDISPDSSGRGVRGSRRRFTLEPSGSTAT